VEEESHILLKGTPTIYSTVLVTLCDYRGHVLCVWLRVMVEWDRPRLVFRYETDLVSCLVEGDRMVHVFLVDPGKKFGVMNLTCWVYLLASFRLQQLVKPTHPTSSFIIPSFLEDGRISNLRTYSQNIQRDILHPTQL
jgi:hypothetical protein